MTTTLDLLTVSMTIESVSFFAASPEITLPASPLMKGTR
jgi:hypothetical protein